MQEGEGGGGGGGVSQEGGQEGSAKLGCRRAARAGAQKRGQEGGTCRRVGEGQNGLFLDQLEGITTCAGWASHAGKHILNGSRPRIRRK